MMERILRLFVLHGRLRSGWRVALYLTLYVLGLLAVQTPAFSLYVAFLMLRGVGDLPGLLAAVQPDRLPIWFHLLLKAGELVMLLVLTYVLCRLIDRRGFTSLGFRRGQGWTLDLLLGLALGGVQMLLIFGVEWVGGWLSVSLLDGAALARGLAAGVAAAVLFVLVALGEELTFRGYLLVNLRQGTGSAVALGLRRVGQHDSLQ